MRFIADGVDIPDELLWAHEEGRVVFVCGAGVSRAKANLPDFKELTQRVLDDLGATSDDPARQYFYGHKNDNGPPIYDHVFGLLEREFTEKDIRESVARCLNPPSNPDLSAHQCLLTLSRPPGGKTRIVTTNFDRLFEAADSDLPSVTASTFPHLHFDKADWGIVHLHGRVNESYSNSSPDGFVLSKSEFGEAYLSRGWARDFLKEILANYVVVFVGYTADDPPINYLLNGLRRSHFKRRSAYAFQSYRSENELAIAAAEWTAKSVEALSYLVEPDDGFRRLWETLSAWAIRARDPRGWRNALLSKANLGPTSLSPHERGMIAHIVSSESGAKAFAEHRPLIPAEWLAVFDPNVRYMSPISFSGRHNSAGLVDPLSLYGLDSDQSPAARVTLSPSPLEEILEPPTKNQAPPNAWSAFKLNQNDCEQSTPMNLANFSGNFGSTFPYLVKRLNYLSQWTASVSDQPVAAWWAGQQRSLNPRLLATVTDCVEKSSSEPMGRIVADAWRKVSTRYSSDRMSDDSAHSILKRIGKTGWDWTTIDAYSKLFVPRAEAAVPNFIPFPREGIDGPTARDLVRIELNYTENLREIQIPDDVLEAVTRKVRGALVLAEEMQTIYLGRIDLVSILPDDDSESGGKYAREHDFSGNVLLFSEIFQRLAELDPKAARQELIAWPRKSYVFDRLRIWAMGQFNIFPAASFAKFLLSLSEEQFWHGKGARDLLLGLAKRWNEISSRFRSRIEDRLRNGPKSSVIDDQQERSAGWSLSRLNWLSSKGCKFSFELDKENNRLMALAPQWQHEYVNRAADTLDAKSYTVSTDSNFDELKDILADQIIPKLEQSRNTGYRSEIIRDPFLGLSQNEPARALAALEAHTKRGEFNADYWRTFLRHDIRKDDSVLFRSCIAAAIVSLGRKDLAGIASQAASWLKSVAKTMHSENSQLYESTFSEIVASLRIHQNVGASLQPQDRRGRDWVSASINSPVGDLTESLFYISPGVSEGGGGVDHSWFGKIEYLLNLPGDSRCYALVILGFHLNWLFHYNPIWTRNNVLIAIDKNSSTRDDCDAVWSGLFWRAAVPQRPLYEILLPHLKTFVCEQSVFQVRHVESIAGFLLSGWLPVETGERLIENSEMRELILKGDQRFRNYCVSTIDRWADESDLWSKRVPEFLRDAWPKQKAVRTSQISARLCALALSRKDNFPEISGLVARFAGKIVGSNSFVSELDRAKDGLAQQHPEEFLNLMYAVLSENRQDWPWGAEAAVKAAAEAMPSLRGDPRYIELEARMS